MDVVYTFRNRIGRDLPIDWTHFNARSNGCDRYSRDNCRSTSPTASGKFSGWDSDVRYAGMDYVLLFENDGNTLFANENEAGKESEIDYGGKSGLAFYLCLFY